MGLQSALTTALTGLQAAETTIDVVGNNVANSQTVGFKESEAIFATQFLQTLSIGSSPSTNSGGTNPRQVGLGVKVAEISPNFTQGTIEISSNPLDVAIQGDGFLLVQDGTDRLYTRNGQLKLNADNEITTTTGQRILGYAVDDDFNLLTNNLVPLSIPVGQERVAQATGNATLNGVLNPAVAEGDQPEVIESRVLGTDEIPAVDGTDFTLADVVEAATPTSFTAADSGVAAGLELPGGVYRYRMVFIDDNGLEAGISTEVEIDTSVSGEGVFLDNLQPAPANYMQRAIYRTDPGGTEFKFLETINATDTDYTDDGNTAVGATLDDAAIDTGAFSYYITYNNPSDPSAETRPTNRVGPVSITDNGRRIRLDLTDIPAPPDPNYTQMKIYRNISGDSSDFRLVDTVPAFGQTGYTASYIDSTESSLIAGAEQLNLDGPPANGGTLLTDVVLREGDIYVTPFEPGTLNFSADRAGIGLAEKSLEITSTTTLQEFMEFVGDAVGLDDTPNDIPFTHSTANIEIINGRIVVTSNMGEQNAIDIPLTAFNLTPTGGTIPSPVTLNFNATQKAVGPGTSSEFIAYDSLGLPINVRITTVLETRDSTSTTYRWFASSADNQLGEPDVSTVVGNGVLVFDGNGDLDDDNSTQRISVHRNDTASISPLEVILDFSSVKALGEVDAQQNPISSLNVTNQDGFPPGVLTDFIITNDGVIQGQFSNGTQRTVGQLVMARFANNDGLQQVGDSLFNVGVNSGDPTFGVPGSEGIGTLSAGAVELSNTDIGQNLIELILASTQYRGGARVITATQELLDELLALSR